MKSLLLKLLALLKFHALTFLARLSCMLAAAVGAAVVSVVFDQAVYWISPLDGGEILPAVIVGSSYGAVLAFVSCMLANPVKKPSACAQLMQLFAVILVVVSIIDRHSDLQMRFSDIAPLVAMYLIAVGATLSVNFFGNRYLPRLFPSLVAAGDGPAKA